MTITAQQIVDRDVIYCVSTLVYELTQKLEQFPEYEEDLSNAWQSEPDYREAAEAEGWTITAAVGDESPRFVKNYDPENPDDAEWSDADDYRELCDDERIDADDYRREVYEHWIVSDWLADKLEENGERILRDLFGMTIWCRTTTGQAIYIDGVFDQIAADIQEAA